ncbi:hypothetical protein P0D69_33650 [Paraburkholderia sediminicola]|uniref:Mu transposase C-terminal domain-containing protein n=1 Tax=Paraburkholderia sediminicola TaxID=458836 RepID=UPI0038B7E336
MLTTEKLEEIFGIGKVTAAGRELVLKARKSDPKGPSDYRVRGRLAGEFSSAKMGTMIWCPNATELFPVLMDIDGSRSLCQEFWQWVREIGIHYTASRDGRDYSMSFTPFLLEIRGDGIRFADFIKTKDLEKAVQRGSNRYVQDEETGAWRSPPVEAALERFGFGYHIYTEFDFGDYWLANAAYLQNPLSGDYEVRDLEACERLVKLLQDSYGFLPIKEILDEKLLSRGDLNYLIARQILYFPLMTESAADTRQGTVFVDEAAYHRYLAHRYRENALLGGDGNSPAIGMQFRWHGQGGWSVVDEDGAYWLARKSKVIQRIPKTDFRLKVQEHEIIPDIRPVSPMDRDSQKAIEFAKFKRDVSDGVIPPIWREQDGHTRNGKRISHVVLSRWQSQYEAAKLKYPEDPVLGLIPAWRDRGGRSSADPDLLELWDDIYRKRVLGDHWDLATTHREFSDLAKQKGLKPWVYETSRVRWNEAKNGIFLESMHGRTVRYAYAGHVSPAKRNKLYNFEKPYILAHADHTPVSMKIENSATGNIIRTQLWLSYLIDNATGEKLAYVLCFWPPSARTIALLLFACLERHSFLPAFIVLDNAPEFHSVVTHKIANEARCSLLWRPPYEPRYGGSVESANRQTEVRNLRMLVGQTVTVKNLETYSRAFKASKPELMTLTELMAHLDAAFFDVELNSGSTKSGTQTMRQHIDRLLEDEVDEHGVPTYRTRLGMTEDVRRICMPPAPKGGTRIVRPGGWVEYQNLPYYHESLKRLAKKTVEIVPDLIDPTCLYVYYKGLKEQKWLTCICERLLPYAHFTRREFAGVFAEMRRDGIFRKRANAAKIVTDLIRRLKAFEQDPARVDVRAGKVETVLNMRGRAGFRFMPLPGSRVHAANAGSPLPAVGAMAANTPAASAAATTEADGDEMVSTAIAPEETASQISPPQSSRRKPVDSDDIDDVPVF